MVESITFNRFETNSIITTYETKSQFKENKINNAKTYRTVLQYKDTDNYLKTVLEMKTMFNVANIPGDMKNVFLRAGSANLFTSFVRFNSRPIVGGTR